MSEFLGCEMILIKGLIFNEARYMYVGQINSNYDVHNVIQYVLVFLSTFFTCPILYDGNADVFICLKNCLSFSSMELHFQLVFDHHFDMPSLQKN